MAGFQDIFPGCSYADADVTQMLRERDCGYLSVKTIQDALRTAARHEPGQTLLYIDDAGELAIRKDLLSVNGNEQAAYSRRQRSYYYHLNLQDTAAKVRQEIAATLSETRMVRYYQNTTSITVAEESFEVEYDYSKNVASQNYGDHQRPCLKFVLVFTA